MKTPAEIIDGLGPIAIANRLNRSATRVYRVRFEKHIPASWYVALCDMAGEKLPISAFGFEGMET
jgi:hypothetical protein